jgi:Helix-turn-helix domain of resolvase
VIKGIPRPEGRRPTTCGSPGSLDAPTRCDSWRYHSDWRRAIVSGPIRDRGPRTLSALAGDGDAARARGRSGGRPRKLDDPKKRHAAVLHGDPANSVRDICRTLGISKAMLYRYLADQRRAAAGPGGGP